jgi:hypothetical protein
LLAVGAGATVYYRLQLLRRATPMLQRAKGFARRVRHA